MFSDKATLLKHFGLQSKSLGEINTRACVAAPWQARVKAGEKAVIIINYYNVASYIQLQCEVMMTAFVCQVHLLYTTLGCPGSGRAVMMFSFTHNPLIMF